MKYSNLGSQRTVERSTLRVGLVTLGCDKNTVDNEYLAGLLEQSGCELVLDSSESTLGLDAVVVTTCGFIDSAKAQSIDAIVQLAERKRDTGNPRRLFVAGCLAQRYADELLAEIPEIDGLVGVGQFKRLAQMILEADRAGEPREDVAAQGCRERPAGRYLPAHATAVRLDSRPLRFPQGFRRLQSRLHLLFHPADEGPAALGSA